MIEVIYDKKKYKVTVKGHAQSGEKGHDLICAAASILVYTLAANVQQVCKNKSLFRRPVIKIEEGDSEIGCTPIHGISSVATIIFDSVCSGFDVLSQQYPQNISYKVVG